MPPSTGLAWILERDFIVFTSCAHETLLPLVTMYNFRHFHVQLSYGHLCGHYGYRRSQITEIIIITRGVPELDKVLWTRQIISGGVLLGRCPNEQRHHRTEVISGLPLSEEHIEKFLWELCFSAVTLLFRSGTKRCQESSGLQQRWNTGREKCSNWKWRMGDEEKTLLHQRTKQNIDGPSPAGSIEDHSERRYHWFCKSTSAWSKEITGWSWVLLCRHTEAASEALG